MSVAKVFAITLSGLLAAPLPRSTASTDDFLVGKDTLHAAPDTLRHCALGLGCDRGTPATTLHRAIDQALAQAGLRWHNVAAVASIDLKADEPCMLQLGTLQNWHICFLPAHALAAVQVPNPSETVRKYTGTPSVSEAAALLVGGLCLGHAQALPASHLLVEKHKLRGPDGRNATVSVAALPLAATASQLIKPRNP